MHMRTYEHVFLDSFHAQKTQISVEQKREKARRSRIMGASGSTKDYGNNWGNMTVAALRLELKKRNLLQAGKKLELVQRLKACDEEQRGRWKMDTSTASQPTKSTPSSFAASTTCASAHSSSANSTGTYMRPHTLYNSQNMYLLVSQERKQTQKKDEERNTQREKQRAQQELKTKQEEHNTKLDNLIREVAALKAHIQLKANQFVNAKDNENHSAFQLKNEEIQPPQKHEAGIPAPLTLSCAPPISPFTCTHICH